MSRKSRQLKGRISQAFLAAGALLAVASAGCHSDKPHEYGQQRPDVNDLDSRDRGLQSRDVNQAADQMAADLLASRVVTDSRTQLTVVVTPPEDRTIDRRGRVNYAIFIQALQDRLARQGEGRITLIANRDQFYDVRSKELEGGGRDEFGQGGRTGPGPAPDAVSPDFALNGVVMDMPNRGTNYYQIEFRLQSLRNRTIPWTRVYPVKVAR